MKKQQRAIGVIVNSVLKLKNNHDISGLCKKAEICDPRSVIMLDNAKIYYSEELNLIFVTVYRLIHFFEHYQSKHNPCFFVSS